MLMVHQLGRHLQVYQDKELMQHAATHHQTTSEPSKRRRKEKSEPYFLFDAQLVPELKVVCCLRPLIPPGQ